MRAGMKGQMVFEFVIAAIIFIGIVIYVMNYVNASVDSFSSDFNQHMLESKAVGISELLMKNPGHWETGMPTVLGLAKEWPVLDDQKINDLFFDVIPDTGYCDGDPGRMQNIRGMLSLSEKIQDSEDYIYNFKIKLEKTDGTPLGECPPPGTQTGSAKTGSITRYALLENGDTVKLEVTVW